MASIGNNPNLRELHPDMDIYQRLSDEVPEIMINIKTGEYIFMDPVAKRIAGVGVQFFLVGAVAGVVVVGGNYWN